MAADHTAPWAFIMFAGCDYKHDSKLENEKGGFQLIPETRFFFGAEGES